MAKYKISLSVDEDVWRQFQAVCTLQRTYPSAVLEVYMQRWLQEHAAETQASLTPTPTAAPKEKRPAKKGARA